jgi:hypothetical protein
VPAQRSRTLNWRTCLEQVHERNGSLEIAVVRDGVVEDSADHHLVWRVRLLAVNDNEVLVEQPGALGKTIAIDPGAHLVVVLAIGQNRWMFKSTNLGTMEHRQSGGRGVEGLRLSLPEIIERCRRNAYRVETASLNLPHVEIWPLLDPSSVLLAERANEIQFELAEAHGEQAPELTVASSGDDELMPQVGPQFTARLMNIGGGGIGLRIAPEDGQQVSRHKLFWMRFRLVPELPTPICVTAKLVHTHLESNQDTYAGLAFDFAFNPGHQRFVIDQICRYIALQQRAAHQRLDEDEPRRRSA